MPESCTDYALSMDYPKTVQDLYIWIADYVEADTCFIACTNPCFAGEKHFGISLGEKKIVTCDGSLGYYWTVEYKEYLSPYAAKLVICKVISEPEPEPEPEPTPTVIDYARISEATESIVSEASVKASDERAIGIALTNTLNDNLNTAISDLKGEYGTISDSIDGKLAGVKDKIDGLKFPTIDSIRDAFLSVCADLAVALWDAILDKIEERYPKDEEEGV